MQKAKPPTTIFVTGTDTGVGKTLLTAHWLHALRKAGRPALAMKPFCSGGREDVDMLQALQPGELPDSEANPFYFSAPLAPLAAARRVRDQIPLATALARIGALQSRCETLLVEGSGGVLVPLGPDYTVLDLVGQLPCATVVVARDRLGTINHTALTVRALAAVHRQPVAVILMTEARPDLSAKSNAGMLTRLLPGVPILRLPHLGPRATQAGSVRKNFRRVARCLQRLNVLAGLD